MLTNGVIPYSTTVTKALRARGAAVAAPVPLGGSSSISSLQRQQRLRPSLVRAAAAAAAPTGPQAGAGLLERVKAMVKGIAAGLPLVAFSTISGGVLAGSLHTVTGAPSCSLACLGRALDPRLDGKQQLTPIPIPSKYRAGSSGGAAAALHREALVPGHAHRRRLGTRCVGLVLRRACRPRKCVTTLTYPNPHTPQTRQATGSAPS